MQQARRKHQACHAVQHCVDSDAIPVPQTPIELSKQACWCDHQLDRQAGWANEVARRQIGPSWDLTYAVARQLQNGRLQLIANVLRNDRHEW